jgi:hypothetical protein
MSGQIRYTRVSSRNGRRQCVIFQTLYPQMVHWFRGGVRIEQPVKGEVVAEAVILMNPKMSEM